MTRVDPGLRLPDGVVLEHRPCPLGCPSQDEVVLVGRDRVTNLSGRYTIVRCRECGLMRTDPRPTAETIGVFYPAEYQPYQSTVVRAGAPADSRSPLWRRFAHRVVRLDNQHLPEVPAGRMLEIGCASGSFLHRMATRGWDVAGLEYSPTAGEKARSLGYPVHIGALETAPDPAQPYDLIVGWMVLEHLHEPILALRKLARWAKPAGWLALSVPNAASWEFATFGDRWYATQVPTHLFHYTPRTIAKVLAEGGWRLERIHYQRSATNWVVSLGHVLQDRFGSNPLTRQLLAYPTHGPRKELALLPITAAMSLLRQAGRITVWARRDPDASGIRG